MATLKNFLKRKRRKSNEEITLQWGFLFRVIGHCMDLKFYGIPTALSVALLRSSLVQVIYAPFKYALLVPYKERVFKWSIQYELRNFIQSEKSLAFHICEGSVCSGRPESEFERFERWEMGEHPIDGLPDLTYISAGYTQTDIFERRKS